MPEGALSRRVGQRASVCSAELQSESITPRGADYFTGRGASFLSRNLEPKTRA
jgi:hypothetical protein